MVPLAALQPRDAALRLGAMVVALRETRWLNACKHSQLTGCCVSFSTAFIAAATT